MLGTIAPPTRGGKHATDDPLRPVDETGETAPLRVVQVNVGNERICELTLYPAGDLGSIAYVRVDDGMRGIISANRDQTIGNIARNLARGERSPSRALSHEDRPRCLVRRKGGLVHIRQQQQLLSSFGVEETNSAGKAGALVRDDAHGAQRGKLRVG